MSTIGEFDCTVSRTEGSPWLLQPGITSEESKIRINTEPCRLGLFLKNSESWQCGGEGSHCLVHARASLFYILWYGRHVTLKTVQYNAITHNTGRGQSNSGT